MKRQFSQRVFKEVNVVEFALMNAFCYKKREQKCYININEVKMGQIQ